MPKNAINSRKRRDKKKNSDKCDGEILDDEVADANSEKTDDNYQQMKNEFSLSDIDADHEADAMAYSQCFYSDFNQVPTETDCLGNGGVHLPYLKNKRHRRS